eukprot:GFKZ01003347.1.p1 GENE.GFKZ01003347.1~~GFKZ01003347.1.p1  ORF type:complete len:338 (-),score=46.19 GFKZ01003347.1:655-1668(-)
MSGGFAGEVVRGCEGGVSGSCVSGRGSRGVKGGGALESWVLRGVVGVLGSAWGCLRSGRMERSVWFWDGALNEERRRLYGMVSGEGVVLLRYGGCFSGGSWATDVFVMFHNAVREEVEVLYGMLRGAAVRVEGLRAGEVGLVEAWVVEFGQLVSMYLLVQERVVYPGIRACVGPGGMHGVCTERVGRWAGDIVRGVVRVHGRVLELGRVCRERADERTTGFDMRRVYEVMGELCTSVREMVSEMEALFAWEVEVMGGVVERGMGRGEVWALVERGVGEMLEYEVGERVWGAVAARVPAEVRERLEAGVGVAKRGRLRRKEKKWVKGRRALQMRFAGR